MARIRRKKTTPKKSDYLGRNHKTFAVIGDKAQGKSHFLRKFALSYYNSAKDCFDSGKTNHQKRVLIHDPSEASAFSEFQTITIDEIQNGIRKNGKRYKWVSGIRRIENDADAYDDKLVMEVISAYFRNGLVIFDEATDWMDNSRLKKWQKELFTKHRNKGLDLMYVFHNFMNIPRLIRPHIWTYVIFRTPEKPKNSKWFAQLLFPNPEEFYRLWCKVERAVHKPYNGTPQIQHYEVLEKSFKSTI